MQPIKLHRFVLSGHSHRAELMLSLLGLPCQLIDVDLPARAHKRPEFVALNRFGQVPVLQDGDVTVADSNAILVYLASRYRDGQRFDWLPTEPVHAAQVQRWLSVAAGLLVFGPARARLKQLFNAPSSDEETGALAASLFSVMEAELQTASYVTGPTPTIADVSLYSYVARAPEGNVSLDPYPAIRTWLGRVEALPGFVAMPKASVHRAA